jgi:small subunit ribosomal protein S6
MFLLKSGETSLGAEAHCDVVRGVIEKREGAVKEIKVWDDRKLAYEIGRHKRGVYVLTYFEAPEDAIAQVKRDCTLSEDILRVLILRADGYAKKEPEAAEEDSTHAG